MSSRILNNISVLVSVHSLNSSIVGFSMSFSSGIIFEKPSHDATFLQSQLDFLSGFSDFENWSSQLKSFTFSGRCSSYTWKQQKKYKMGADLALCHYLDFLRHYLALPNSFSIKLQGRKPALYERKCAFQHVFHLQFSNALCSFYFSINRLLPYCHLYL